MYAIADTEFITYMLVWCVNDMLMEEQVAVDYCEVF